MKQIIAVIRDDCVEMTQVALARFGIVGFITFPVMGRGQQKGVRRIPDQDGTLGHNAGLHLRRPATGTIWPAYRPPIKKKTGFGFLPKQMLIILAPDDIVGSVVQTLIAVNQSGRHGDGKIFVCPIGSVF